MFGLTLILTLVAQLLGMGVGYLLSQQYGVSLLPGDEADGDLAMLSWSWVAGTVATAFAEMVIGIGLTWATFQAVRAKKAAPLAAARQIAARFWPTVGLYALPLLAGGAVIAAVAVLIAPLAAKDQPWVWIPVGIGGGFAAACLAVRLLLAPCVIAIENRGPIAAIRRSWALTRGQFWRIVGIYLATTILISLATNMLSTVFLFVGSVITAANAGIGATVMLSSSTITVAVFSLPLTSALVTLLYVDARFRTEAFDLELSEELFG